MLAVVYLLIQKTHHNRESGPYIVQSCPFIHVAQNRRLSVSDVFSPTRNTQFGLGKEPRKSMQEA